MSINRDMEQWTLQRNKETRSASGASKENWTDIQKILVAVYEKDELRRTDSARYQEATNTGLTYFKNFDRKKQYRLVSGGRCLEITSCNVQGRLTNLLLKEVESYGGG